MNKEKRDTVNASRKKTYETPVFQEEKGMDFPEEIREEFNGGNWCFGCTNCNCN
jgi:hypothetical protein